MAPIGLRRRGNRQAKRKAKRQTSRHATRQKATRHYGYGEPGGPAAKGDEIWRGHVGLLRKLVIGTR
jgi:hypothetical protein